MRSTLSSLPLLAMTFLLLVLLLLDFAFFAAPEVLAAFVPALIWAGIFALRGRG